jgi:hypothetical protein
MLDALRRRYTRIDTRRGVIGGVHRYAWAEHVPASLSWSSGRIADFVAVDCYKRRGVGWTTEDAFDLHGHEVKVSRSDWLAELRDPTKADAWRRFCDRWWLCVSDRSIVKDGELPEGWGLMVLAGPALRVVYPAPLLTPEPMPRMLLASLMRATAKSARRSSSPVSEGVQP